MQQTAPTRAAVISFAALTVAIVSSLSPLASMGAGGNDVLVWALPLIPAFLLAYYRGWDRVALALAAGMAAVALTGALTRRLDLAIGWHYLFAATTAFVGICLSFGIYSVFIHREREDADRLALTDALTGLPNRRHVHLALDTEFAAARRGRPLSVVLWDIDGLQHFNEVNGRKAGDEILKAFGDLLARNTRRMNLSGRVDGQQFLSVLSSTDLPGARVFAEQVRWRLRSVRLGGGGVSVCAGIATFDVDHADARQLLAAASQALKRAKAKGRNRIEVQDLAPQPPVPQKEPV